MFKIGDYVTRKKYNNDILFKIKDIKDDNIILCGVDLRLYADSNEKDLVLSNYRIDNEEEIEEIKLDKKYFYIPGIILHLDSDKDYLNKCLKYYKKLKIKCFGELLEEDKYIDNIERLINKYNPTIVVITGHDAYYKNNKYKNSKYFIETVKYIRNTMNKKDIIIISGACQSDFYNLIKNGSNFASSPSHINIHALDPAIIAANIALLDKKTTVDLDNLLSKTKYGSDGIGGVETNGVMIIGYPRKDIN